VIFPLEGERGLINARSIIRTYPGLVQDAYVLEACAFLIEHGDWVDVRQATAERDRITEAAVRELNNRLEPSPVAAIVFWGGIFSLVMTILLVVAA
jgi:hypothetical protein